MERKQYKRWITLAHRIGHEVWKRYGAKWLTIPSLDDQRSPGSFTKKNRSPLAGEPVLAVCCVQDLFQHDVIEQTLAFVQRLGYSLAVDKKQPCCGALFERLIHGGKETIFYPQEQQRAISLQRRALHRFLKWLPTQAYFLAQGCQSFAAKHSCQARDLYAWIEVLLQEQRLTLYFSQPREVYYQPYCHSTSKQVDPIGRLLKQVEGLIVHEVPYPLACCGGYGGEVLLHPQQAQELAWNKMASLPHHATLIVTSPDCWGLFKRYQANRDLTILYPIQLLARALIKKWE
jgi:Fe-S oxidoreductase